MQSTLTIPRPRSLRSRLQAGEKVVATWCSIPSAVTAEVLARAGFDAVIVDLQHGLMDFESALNLLQVIDGQQVPTLCRVHWNEPGIVMKVLDAGFGGVICPMIETAQEAAAFAAACRYPPVGHRSYGPIRAALVHGEDYGSSANDWVLALPMVETLKGFDNLDEILAVPGVDGVYIGPTDLCQSMGFAPSLLPPQPVMDVIDEIRRRAQAAGKVAGIHCGSASMVHHMLEQGFDLATLLSDIRYLKDAMRDLLLEARGQLRPVPARDTY